ncbi:redoxin domain-containing protein [Candidatus Poribacteria bacterium]|nr:redoxin domain-containing protein [Candidatus Poribacteria bacterium]
MENYVKDLQPELRVSYCKLIAVSVDNTEITHKFREQIGAEWPFLIDADRKLINELDIVDNTDRAHSPIPIPYTFVLDGNREIYKIYNGWWFVGRPTVEELRHDLRTLIARRPDYAYNREWDVSEEARKKAFL